MRTRTRKDKQGKGPRRNVAAPFLFWQMRTILQFFINLSKFFQKTLDRGCHLCYNKNVPRERKRNGKEERPMAKHQDKKSRREVVELATAILMAITALIELLRAIIEG